MTFRPGRFLPPTLCAVALGCQAQPTAIEIRLRGPQDSTLREGVETFVLSVEDSRGTPLVLRRFDAGSRSVLRLDDIPFGPRLTFRFEGLYRETPLVRGRSCPIDVLAGQPLPAVSMFVSRMGSFARIADPLDSPRSSPLVFLQPDGRVVMAGGEGEGGALASAESFDPRSGDWNREPPLSGVRRSGEAAAAGRSEVLVIGGEDGAGAPVDRIEIYRTGAGFAPTFDRGFGGAGLRATSLPDGRVLVTGGEMLGGVARREASIFDGSLRQVGSLTVPRRGHTVSVLGLGAFAAAFVIGGDGGDRRTGLREIEVFNPRTGAGNAFTMEAARLGEGRTEHTATVLPSGEILVVGGRAQDPPLASAELFDPITRAVAAAGRMERGRYWHAATLLPDGRVLVTGGIGEDGRAMRSSEIYDPAFGAFAAARPMAVERARHAAIALCDGTVLLVGGGSGAEIYNPAR